MFAALWDSQPDGTVVCRLCAHRCRLRNGAKGICGVRVNMRGKLVSLVSQVVTAAAMDPVEKKEKIKDYLGMASEEIERLELLVNKVMNTVLNENGKLVQFRI